MLHIYMFNNPLINLVGTEELQERPRWSDRSTVGSLLICWLICLLASCIVEYCAVS